MTEEAEVAAEVPTEVSAPETKTEVAETPANADTVQDDQGKAEASPEVADEEDGDPADADTDEDKQRKPTSRKQRYQRRIAALEAENEALRAQKARDAISELKPPKEEDFNGDYEAFNRAVIAHDVAKALRADNAQREVDAANARLAEVRKERMDEHRERMDEFRKVAPDFDDVVSKGLNVPMHDAILDLLVESAKGPMLAYHLAKKPELVKEIASLSPIVAAKRLGEIEARLSLPNPKKQTQAPAPATPIKGGATAAPDPSKMTMEQYTAWRKSDATAS